eukprot:UN13519
MLIKATKDKIAPNISSHCFIREPAT